MTFELFDYQKTGADFLAGRRRALLLDAPGLGKTAQAIAASDLAGADSMYTVCPASVVKQWRRNHDDVSVTGNIFRSYSYEAARDKGISRWPSVICLDELHYLKNGSSGRTKALLGEQLYGRDGIIAKAEYVWGMTGTVMPKDPGDLFPILNAIIPGALSLKNGNIMDYWQFMRKFCVMYDSGYGMVVSKGKNLAELRERIAPFMLRRTKPEVMKDWKEPLRAELWLDAGDAADKLHKADLEPEARAVADAFKKGGFSALKVLADSDRSGISRYRRYVGILKILPIVAWLLDEFGSGLDKIVIICVHREVIEGIAEKLAQQKIETVIYYGGMTDAQKDKAKDKFVKEKTIRGFIGQIGAAGTGVDGLQHATGDILFVEWSWVGDDNQQAIDRLDRIGQNNPVLARFAGLEGSLDGAIMAKASRRTSDNKQLFG